MSRTETITCLLKILTFHGCEERMGDQKGTKVAPWCKHYTAAVGEKAISGWSDGD